jgi:hypothetical protein
MFIKVDLPEPEGPMIATISPQAILSERPLRACTSTSPILYTFVRFSAWMTQQFEGISLLLVWL